MGSTGKMKDQCLEIEGTLRCVELDPTGKKNCVNVSGINFCERDGKEATTFKQERKKFLDIIIYPKMRLDETKKLETNIVVFTIGIVLSALVFTLSLFIKDVIDIIMISLFPSSVFNIFILLFIIIVIIGVSLVLSFVQNRVQTAFNETDLLEKFAEKDPVEIAGEVFST